jgi:hypothetical protein
MGGIAIVASNGGNSYMPNALPHLSDTPLLIYIDSRPQVHNPLLPPPPTT